MQQIALCATGFIWSRYSMVITPVNYNLFLVNISLAVTGTYHLARKIKHELNEGLLFNTIICLPTNSN